MRTGAESDGQGRSWKVLIPAVGVTALGGMPVWLLSALAPQISAEYRFDSVQLGLAIGGFFGVSAILGVLAGRLVERVGWRYGLAISALGSCVACATMAISPWMSLGIVTLILCGAISNSTSHPASNLGIAERVPPTNRATALGIKQAALPIATFLVGVSVPLFEGPAGWRVAFAVVAVCAIIVALSVFSPGHLVLRLRAFGRYGEPQGPQRTNESHGRAPKGLWTLASGAGLGSAATMSLGGFLVSYVASRGYTAAEAGFFLALGSAVGISARITSGLIADRLPGKHFIMVAGMMIAGTLGIGLLAWGNSFAVILLGTILAYGLGWSWNGVFHFAVIRNVAVTPSRATGVVQTAMSLGSMVGPATFGLLAEMSYHWAWASSGAAMLGGAFLIVWGNRSYSS